MFKFRNIEDIETFLLESLGTELLIPSNKANEAVFFHNGDKMTVNITTGEVIWEPIKSGDMFTSRLSLRLHQWFGKGIIDVKN